MQIIGDIFNVLLLAPLINLLVWIFKVVEGFGIPGALGVSIILLTILIKFILWPFTSKQIISSRELSIKMTKLKPELELLKHKHKDNKLAFSQAQGELFKTHGINPVSGCLPALVQILLILPLYQVILAFLEGEKGLERINYFLYNQSWHLNKLPDPHFLSLNLAAKPSDFASVGVVVLSIPIITGIIQLILSLMMAPSTVKKYPSDSPKEKKQKQESQDAMAAAQSQMTFMLPAMTAFFAFSFPIGLALYWNVLNIISIIQQYKFAGWGKLAKYLPHLKDQT